MRLSTARSKSLRSVISAALMSIITLTATAADLGGHDRASLESPSNDGPGLDSDGLASDKTNISPPWRPAPEASTEAEGKALPNASSYPKTRTFQVHLRDQKHPQTAVVRGNYAVVGDRLIGEVSGTQVISLGKQVILNLEDGTGVAPKGIVATGKSWPGGVVPYEIDPSVSDAARAAVEGAKADYHAKTVIRFVPRTNEADYVRIISSGNDCWSFVGKVGGKQDLSLGPRCNNVNLARHELGHAIGLHHEQARQDRDTWVVVNTDEGIVAQPEAIFVGAYNFESMMHNRNYPRANGGWDFVPKTNYPPELVGNNHLNDFSPGDLATIQYLYGNGIGDGVCFYADIDYGGESFCAISDIARVGLLWNDRISSVKVAPGYTVTLRNDIDFGGIGLGCACDIPNLVQYEFNDLTSSMRIERQ